MFARQGKELRRDRLAGSIVCPMTRQRKPIGLELIKKKTLARQGKELRLDRFAGSVVGPTTRRPEPMPAS